MNESIYRSPKWLRNFADFEINTGDDIKGELSKKAKIRKLENEKREKFNNTWDNIDIRHFMSYLSYYNNDFVRKHFNYSGLYYSDSHELKKILMKDPSLLYKYVIWNEDVKKNNKIIDDIYNMLEKDFINNPDSSKCSTGKNKGYNNFYYYFDNGDVLEFISNKELKFDGKKGKFAYELNDKTYMLFLNLINRIVDYANSTYQKKTRNNYYSNTGEYEYTDKTTDPKKIKYNKIKDKIRLREIELSKLISLNPNDINIENLRNELDTYRNILNKMKKTYNFEHIMNFNSYYFV